MNPSPAFIVIRNTSPSKESSEEGLQGWVSPLTDLSKSNESSAERLAHFVVCESGRLSSRIIIILKFNPLQASLKNESSAEESWSVLDTSRGCWGVPVAHLSSSTLCECAGIFRAKTVAFQDKTVSIYILRLWLEVAVLTGSRRRSCVPFNPSQWVQKRSSNWRLRKCRLKKVPVFFWRFFSSRQIL